MTSIIIVCMDQRNNKAPGNTIVAAFYVSLDLPSRQLTPLRHVHCSTVFRKSSNEQNYDSTLGRQHHEILYIPFAVLPLLARNINPNRKGYNVQLYQTSLFQGPCRRIGPVLYAKLFSRSLTISSPPAALCINGQSKLF